jgi:hypothetical protein
MLSAMVFSPGEDRSKVQEFKRSISSGAYFALNFEPLNLERAVCFI